MSPERGEKKASRKFLVATLTSEGIKTVEKSKKPLLGGYISQKKYGNPDYCPSATRHHKKAKKETGEMKNLIFFDSVDSAVACGFSPCGNCWIKGEMALERWIEYLESCKRMAVKPIPEPKIIKKIS